jgi:hypothetical protein
MARSSSPSRFTAPLYPGADAAEKITYRARPRSAGGRFHPSAAAHDQDGGIDGRWHHISGRGQSPSASCREAIALALTQAVGP